MEQLESTGLIKKRKKELTDDTISSAIRNNYNKIPTVNRSKTVEEIKESMKTVESCSQNQGYLDNLRYGYHENVNGYVETSIAHSTNHYQEDHNESKNESDESKRSKQQNLKKGKMSKAPAQKHKKTKGRVKINMEFIENKIRRYTTFSKRKTGIMKKAYELSTLTGTQVMLLVASETGHVYTFATDKLQPMITSEIGKNLIQSCLSYPQDGEASASPEPRPSHLSIENFDQNDMALYEELDSNHQYEDDDDEEGSDEH